MGGTTDKQLQEIKEQQEKLKSRMQRLTAREQELKARDARVYLKTENRVKFIVGGFILKNEKLRNQTFDAMKLATLQDRDLASMARIYPECFTAPQANPQLKKPKG